MKQTTLHCVLSLVMMASLMVAQNQNKLQSLQNSELIPNLTEQEIILLKERGNSPALHYQASTEKASLMPPNPACTNMDFETGNTNGWSVQYGSTMLNTNNSCLLTGCCSGTNTTYTVLTNGYTDPYIPASPINSQFGAVANGNKFIKLNNELAGGKEQKLSQSFSVTTANSLFKYAYKLVSYQAAHSCCMDAFMNIRFLDQLGNVVPFTLPNFSVTTNTTCVNQPGTATGMTVCPGNINFLHTPWIHGVADLSPYIGKHVTFELVVGDCSAAGHAAYAYFDATCSSLTYSVNGNNMQLDSTNNACVTSFPSTLTAPSGFNTYVWTTSSGTVSGQSLNVNAAGTYTLALTPIGACCPTFKIFNVSVCTGINGGILKQDDIIVFPNPAGKELFFQNIQSAGEYAIYDILGKEVSSKTLIPASKRVDIAHLTPGVYFFKIYSGEKVKSVKVVKE